MKSILKLTLCLLLLISCNDTKKTKALEGVMNEVTGNNEDVNKEYDLLLKELGTKTPLTDAQLIAAFPNKLTHLNLDASEEKTIRPKIMDTQLVAGRYGNDTVRLEILDAAGQKAAGAILPLKMLHLNKVTSENNNTIRYSKKERNGILTFGTDRDENAQSSFQSELRFLYDNRFYVTLEGKGMNTEALWGILNIDDLNRFKSLNK